MGADFWIVLQWWGTLFLVGAVTWPLTKRLFSSWPASTRGDNSTRGWFDQGYLFSKAVGMAVVTWIVFVMGTVRLMPFSYVSIVVALAVVFVVGLLANVTNHESRITNYDKKKSVPTILHTSYFIIRLSKYWKQVAVLIFEELFFLAALLFWSWVKGHEPSIRGLEKFMDYGFMQSILNSQFFPPADMWYAGLPVNYYYFGHMVTAVLTKLSGLDLGVTFNLMLATIFALTLTMSFSIGAQLLRIGGMRGIRVIGGGTLTAFLVTLAGNMQTIYAFTRGYTGENVKPFWELGWNFRDIWGVGGIRELLGKIGEGMNTYWYPNATRFIPWTIHEFPSYSFVVSDVHGHVLSIPFVLLAVALLIYRVARGDQGDKGSKGDWGRILFYGFLVGVLLMTNALDGPIYFALFAAALCVSMCQRVNVPVQNRWKEFILGIGAIGLGAGFTSLPFLVHFKSFVTGVAVNCPPSFLANMKFGPLLFEGAEKCQHSPLWMWWLLWGFFVYCGVGLIYKIVESQKSKVESQISHIDILLIVFFCFALVLVIVPEFIYFKDIYPAHFRSNTMFKLGYEAFILFSIVAGYAIVQAIGGMRGSRGKRGAAIFFLFLLPQLILVSIYPIFSVRSYFNSLKRYEGIDGLGWLRREYPDDWKGIVWLKNSSKQSVESSKGGTQMNAFSNYQLPATSYLSPVVLVEADGDSYTDYARVSAFTGRPTIIGWAVHEWLWRGTYDAVAPRREEVRKIYESEDRVLTASLLNKYSVHYVIVGKLEREKFKSLQEGKFGELGREVYRSGMTVIYASDPKDVLGWGG